MTASARILVIGLELGDGRLLRDWAMAGQLPTLRALIEGGTWGWLETTAGQLHVSAWPSIYTGVGPGEHGVYFTFQPAPGLQGYQRFHEGLYGRPTFWRLLDQAGRRCTVFDAPYTHPEPGFAGTQLFDWGTWAHYLAPQATPKGILGELERACGKYPLGLEAHDLGFRPLDPADTQKRLIAAVRHKAEAACWLMGRREFDLYLAVFGETHVAAHYCWRTDGEQSLLLPIYASSTARSRGSSRRPAPGPRSSSSPATPWPRTTPAGTCCPRCWRGSATSPPPRPPLPRPRRRRPRASSIRSARCATSCPRTSARRWPASCRPPPRQAGAKGRHRDLRLGAQPGVLPAHRPRGLHPDQPQGARAGGHGRAGRRVRGAVPGPRGRARGADRPGHGPARGEEVLIVDQVFPGPRRAWLPDLIVLWEPATAITSVASARVGVVSGASPDPRPAPTPGPASSSCTGPASGRGRPLTTPTSSTWRRPSSTAWASRRPST